MMRLIAIGFPFVNWMREARIIAFVIWLCILLIS